MILGLLLMTIRYMVGVTESWGSLNDGFWYTVAATATMSRSTLASK